MVLHTDFPDCILACNVFSMFERRHGSRKFYKKTQGRSVDSGLVYMARLKICAGGECNERLNGSIGESVESPDLDEVFPVVDGSDLTQEDIVDLANKGIKVDASCVVMPEAGQPRLPTTAVTVNGQSRHRGKPSSTAESRQALFEAEQEKRNAVEIRKKSKEAEKAESVLLDTRPRTRGGKVVQAVRTVNEGLDEELSRSHDIRIGVRMDEKVGRFERVLTVSAAGSVYILTIGQEPSCNCSTFKKMEHSRKRWKHCVHLYAVMYRGLHVKEKFEQTNVLLVHQPSFTKREAQRMCNIEIDRVALDE